MKSLTVKQIVICLILVAGIMLTACSPEAPAPEVSHWSTEVTTHASRGDVEVISEATADIVTGDTGATLNINTSELTPGNVYTVWFVTFNHPEGCAASPCTGKDLLSNTEGVDGEVGYATGAIADEDGNGNFFAHMDLGDVPRAWFGNGFDNPYAEIHLVLMDHGPAIEGREDEMLNSLRGGCTDESVPAPYPDTAKTDGFAGPNSCQLYQVAIFVPDLQNKALEATDGSISTQ